MYDQNQLLFINYQFRHFKYLSIFILLIKNYLYVSI